MDLSGLIAISGKPGLYKTLVQTKTGLIVESLIDGKRMPVHASYKVSSLEDISMYTMEDDIPLGDVIQNIYDKEKGSECISHKSSKEELRSYFLEVLPDYDDERVHDSDIKKLMSWYNLLHKSKNLVIDKKEESKETKSTSAKASADKSAGKKATKATTDKPASTKATADKPASAKASAGKPVAKKTTKASATKKPVAMKTPAKKG